MKAITIKDFNKANKAKVGDNNSIKKNLKEEMRKMTTIRRRKTGFFITDNAIFDRKDLSANEKLVYLYFCRRANSENKAWPSYQRIADDCGFSRKTVIEVIKKLINKSLLKKNTRSNQSTGNYTTNEYTLLPVSDCNTGSSLNASSKVNTPRGCNYYTTLVQEIHPKNTQNKNTQRKASKEKERESVSQSVSHDRQTNTSNFLQSKINSRKSRKINKLSLEEEIQKLGATKEQVERARQRMEEYKKATGAIIWNIERYFLAVLRSLIKFEKITKGKEKPRYERDREYRRKIFEALLMS